MRNCSQGNLPEKYFDMYSKHNHFASEIYRFAMLEHKTEEEVISRFVINPVLDQDAGQITCEAANRYGRDQKNFLLSIEGTHFTQFLSQFCQSGPAQFMGTVSLRFDRSNNLTMGSINIDNLFKKYIYKKNTLFTKQKEKSCSHFR